MAYHVYLDLFEGPLDLLLFLIGKAQIDVKDIFISKVTSQYLEFVNLLDDTDLDRSSEFIEMAARLLEIKSRKLLPKLRIEVEEEDPEIILIRQLEDYRLIKEASRKLISIGENALSRFYRTPTQIDEKIELDLSGVSVDTLTQAFLELMVVMDTKDIDDEISEIIREEFTVPDKISHITTMIKIRGKLFFSELFYEGVGKYEVIITFMALLEMVKLAEIKVSQDSMSGEIIVST